MATTNRLKHIDIARGIAMLCIILGHFNVGVVNRIVFTFHVPIFFFITGYFISDKLSMKDFIKNKARTLLVPYICTCIITILLATIMAFASEGVSGAWKAVTEWLYASLYGAGNSFTEPFYIKAIGALWFLLATFWGSVFLRIALNLKTGSRIVFVLVLFFAGVWTAKEFFWFPFSIQAGCCATLFMYLGHLLKGIKNQIQKVSMEIKVLFSVFACIIWLGFIKNFQSFWLVRADVGRGAIDILGSICGCYMIFLVSMFLDKKTKYISNLLSFLGRYSLIMLCVHIIELNLFDWDIVDNFFMHFGISQLLSKCMKAVVKFVFIIGVTFVCSKCTFITKLFGLTKKTGEAK